MNRRKFIRGTGILGGLLGGVLAGKEVIERIHTKETIVREMLPAPVNVADADMGPIGNTQLLLQGSSKPPEVPMNTSSGMYFISSQPKYDLQVGLAVGRDKRLWIKVDNEWRRVSLDPNSNEG
jgi:hypothetical protein